MKHELSKERRATLRQHPELITRDEVVALLAAHEQEPDIYLCPVTRGGEQLFSPCGRDYPRGRGYYTYPAPSIPAAPDSKQVDELTMWVKRLAHSLKNANPDSKLHSNAMDYLNRKGLIGVEDILR